MTAVAALGRGRAGRAAVVVLVLGAGARAWAGDPQAPRAQRELAPLIEKIARGSPDEAADATGELVRQVVEPLASAIGAVGQRPAEEQRRLLEALSRAGAVLRIRLYQAELPPEDARLFEQALAADRDLLERLFDDDPRRRLAALYQIPLEPGSAAGVLIAAKLYDWDAMVLDTALEVAGQLKDEVVARGLVRVVQRGMAAVCSSQFGPQEPELQLVWTSCSRKAVRVLGEARSTESVPVILEAIRCFGRAPYRGEFYVAEALEALGKIGDERAVPVLLEFLSDREVYTNRSLGPGKLLQVTVGDAALLALVRIYKLSPADLGFITGPPNGPITGFVEEKTRAAAVRAFGAWYKENGQKPVGQREPLPPPAAGPATQPGAAAPAERP